MSGIGGIVSFRPTSSLPDEIDKVAAALAGLYPDRTDIWTTDDAALCHALLHTVAQDTATQPVEGSSSALRIVCDSRLDNRPELIASLNLNSNVEAISDAEIILKAYEAWGEHAPKELIGDYAFAIYDPHKKEVFCARDPMGMRPFYYAFERSKFFAFASSADSLAAVSEVSSEINERRVADFLANLEGADFDSTFYEGVFRLPPAHSLKANHSNLEMARFWVPESKPTLRLPTNDAYVDAFLKVFTEAVRCRLRSAGPVASMLSGGMDSNAITAIADELLKKEDRRLITISAVGPDPSECTETAMILRSLGSKDVDAHTVRHDKLDAILPRLRELTDASLEPFDATSVHNRSVYVAAHDLGVRVVLDGAAGDVMMHAGNRVASLFAKGAFFGAWREVKAENQFWGYQKTAWKSFLASAWASFAPLKLRRMKHDLVGRIRGNSSTAEYGMLRPEFVKRSGLASRRRRYFRYLEAREPYGPAYLAKVLSHPNLTVGRERYQRIASQLQIECRDPFTDLRVIDFCLSLPPEQFQDAGWPKILLRRALERYVPAEVVWRRGKTHLGPAFLSAYRRKIGREISRDVPTSLSRYVRGINRRSVTDPDLVEAELESLSKWLIARDFAADPNLSK